MPRSHRVKNCLLLLFMWLGCACLLSLSSIKVYADGCDGTNFKGARDYAFAQYLYAVVPGDFNNDGKADVAGVDFSGNNLRVVLGDGAGGIASVGTFNIGAKPTHIAAGDLNNDGKLDLVASNSDSHNVSVLLNNGSGGFAITNYPAGVGPGAIALADFNSDSKLDVAVTNSAGNAIVFFLNNGSGGLLSMSFVFMSGKGPQDIVTADFNNDGKADLATVNIPGSDVAVLLGTGTGTFAAPVYVSAFSTPMGDPSSIAVGDFTGDAKLDLIVGSYFAQKLTILPGNGAGGFTVNPTQIFVAGYLSDVDLKDINSDSKLDIVVPIYDSIIQVFYGTGLGGVAEVAQVMVGSLTRSAAITDLNGDGKLDMAATYASLYDSGLSVSLNDGAGKLESADYLVTGANLAPYLVDIDLDGRTDLITPGVTVRINGGLGPPTTYPAAIGALTFGDFNRDNRPDVATVGNGSVYVLLNNGHGGFGAATLFGIGSNGSTLVNADFNNDGNLDIAVAGYSSRSVRVLTGDGLGNFLLTGAFSVGANPSAIVVGDFNTDGKPDVITANDCMESGGSCTGTKFRLLPGNGTGGFEAAVNLFGIPLNPSNSGTPFSPQFIAAGDFNGDNKLDVTFVLNPNGGTPGVYVSLSNGGGNFAPQIILPASIGVFFVAVGDVNSDGKLDVVGARGSSTRDIQIFMNNGGGNFDSPINYAGVYVPQALAIGDVNSDGKRDILFSEPGGLRRLLNKCALRRSNQTTDFDGDGITDLSVFRPSNGYWYIIYSSDNTFHPVPFGANGDIPVAADFDGDGRTDVAVFRPSNGTWYYLRSSDGAFAYQQFGASGDIPLPGDYNGDGSADFVVWRQATGIWYTSLDQASNYGAVPWGFSTDLPAPADYDGDGRIDIAVFRPSNATWYLQQTTQGYKDQQFGISTDRPVPADYDGDGRADFAVFRQSTGVWYTSLNPVINYGAIQLGQSGDVTVPGYYDGDGRADAAVFRNGDWYIHQSFNGAVTTTHFGAAGDVPAPVAP